MTEQTKTRALEDVKADFYVLAEKHATIKDRGFDSKRERYALHARIDALLDEYKYLSLLEASK